MKKLFDTLNAVLTLYAFYELFGKVSAFTYGKKYATIVFLAIIAYYSYLFIKKLYNIRKFDVNDKYYKRICLTSKKELEIKKIGQPK